jgi:aconitate hydratase
MGVLPLTFIDGEDAELLGLDGTESFNIPADMKLVPLSTIDIQAIKNSGELINFKAIVRLDTPVEVDYYNNGGILQTVLRNLAKE